MGGLVQLLSSLAPSPVPPSHAASGKEPDTTSSLPPPNEPGVQLRPHHRVVALSVYPSCLIPSIAQFKAVQGGANRLPHGISTGSGFWLEILGASHPTSDLIS